MSRTICASAIEGAIQWVARAEARVDEAVAERGEEFEVAFPETAYHLPIVWSLLGLPVHTLGDCRTVLRRAKELLPPRPSDGSQDRGGGVVRRGPCSAGAVTDGRGGGEAPSPDEVWLPYLGHALDAGVASLFACEVIEAVKYLVGPRPVDGIWLGAASDVTMRERGIEFVDGSAPGFAAITGAAPTNEIAVEIARKLQQKNLYVFMAGSTEGRQFAEQLDEEGVQLGWETRLVPFGADVSALVYALGFANRAALSFGGVKPGDSRANLLYNKDRIFAFVLALGEVDSEKYAVAAGAINYGFPVIADTDIPEILPTGVCTYEHVVSNVPYESMVERALEVRGCKVRITEVPIPVPYGPAFEGERIRKTDVHAEFGGNITPAFEYVTSVGMDEIEDGRVEVVGPDLDEVEPGSALPLAIWAEVAGRKMQPDFEPILERQIHHLVNGASGVWHMGQRDIVWTRVSKEAFAKGVRLADYGRILHAMFLSKYPAIVDKVSVTIYTELEEVERRLAVARRVYDERNRRMESMTDEAVDTFYSCLLCQSFAPDHVCIITPERLGLCGAYNWLDGKAAHEIDETGPNQPVPKGECLDPVRGVWSGVDEYVHRTSHKTVRSFAAYSILDRPMTSCGCFEVILGYVPECNGVFAVNREFRGLTPVGMKFSSLAGEVGGGKQTPGFMGCGKYYLTSRKFLAAEGGHRRLVWMPRELKTLLGDQLAACFERIGEPGLIEKIADETVATEPAEIRASLERAGHPALALPDMASLAAGPPVEAAPEPPAPEAAPPRPAEALAPGADIAAMKAEIAAEIRASLFAELREDVKTTLTREIIGDLIGTLREKYLGESPSPAAPPPPAPPSPPPRGPSARERIAAVASVPIVRDKNENAVWTVELGAKVRARRIGGATAMPFHEWEGSTPHRPLVAMEVFDSVGERYPRVLREIYGDLLGRPAEMAARCVAEYGADAISVRLEGTHPEKGNRSPEQAVALVSSVHSAVDVPLIVTGHAHFEKTNAVLKAVAQAFSGENLLLNWVETDNYRTIAGAALAYGHSVVAKTPIDVNMAKQLDILLTGMDVPRERIVVDPMTGAMGYGIEYTHSIMERIRLTGLGGDPMLAAPMMVTPGQESAGVKELRATREDYPAWGELATRAALWEAAAAADLLYAGADLLVMYHPEAVRATKRLILELVE